MPWQRRRVAPDRWRRLRRSMCCHSGRRGRVSGLRRHPCGDRQGGGEMTTCVHFAPTEKRLRQQDVMCGYVATGDAVSLDPNACTCEDCRAWIFPTKEKEWSDDYVI